MFPLLLQMRILLGRINVDTGIRQRRIERRFQMAIVENMLSQFRLGLPLMDGDGRTRMSDGESIGRGRLVDPAVV
jgi:hypothetical protein